MSQEAARGFIHAFCDALTLRDAGRVALLLDENIEWTVFGPVDLFPFFGCRKGKAAVLAMLRELMSVMQLHHCEHESLVVEGNSAAAMIKINALDLSTGRILSMRLAKFATFQNRRLVALKAVFDSFDVAEQVMGRHIDLTRAA